MVFNDWLSNIQDWLLPRLCPACGNPTGAGRTLCRGCEASLPVLTACCPRCATPYEHPQVAGECGSCQRHPPAYARSVALFHYAPPVDHFIRALKFHHDLGLAQMLGQRLATCLAAQPDRPDLIMPIPLHPTRLRARGYNQALEIARPLAAALNRPLDFRALRRVRATSAQSDLPIAERIRNVRGAFAVRGGTRLEGNKVALVDDVMTSGSTAQAAAHALRAAGAEEVWVWVVARA